LVEENKNVIMSSSLWSRISDISEHISYKEATKSHTALRLDIDNTPDGYQLSNMTGIAHNLFEPLRKWAGGPIKNKFFFSDVKH